MEFSKIKKSFKIEILSMSHLNQLDFFENISICHVIHLGRYALQVNMNDGMNTSILNVYG